MFTDVYYYVLFLTKPLFVKWVKIQSENKNDNRFQARLFGQQIISAAMYFSPDCTMFPLFFTLTLLDVILKSSPLYLFITGSVCTVRDPHIRKPREWFQIFFQSEAVKIQQKCIYYDLKECIEFRDINIIPWENPAVEQLVPKFKQVGRART